MNSWLLVNDDVKVEGTRLNFRWCQRLLLSEADIHFHLFRTPKIFKLYKNPFFHIYSINCCASSSIIFYLYSFNLLNLYFNTKFNYDDKFFICLARRAWNNVVTRINVHWQCCTMEGLNKNLSDFYEKKIF